VQGSLWPDGSVDAGLFTFSVLSSPINENLGHLYVDQVHGQFRVSSGCTGIRSGTPRDGSRSSEKRDIYLSGIMRNGSRVRKKPFILQ